MRTWRAAFARLLSLSSSIFELDGAPDERPRAYEAAGFGMLSNIDLLIVIWDGKEAEGVGGTGQIASRAIADGLPVVWIDPGRPDALQLAASRPGNVPSGQTFVRVRDCFAPAEPAGIAQVVTESFAPPTPKDEKNSLREYLAERERRWNLSPLFPLLRRIFAGVPIRWSNFRLPPALGDSRRQWEPYFQQLPPDRAQYRSLENILLPAFSAADHLAVYYSLIYRGA